MKTTRFLAIVLAALLLVTTVSVVGILAVGAAETEIDTAEEFAALNGQEGNFKLTANITLTGTVASFTGTLDGNGHTLTVSAPVFGTLSGEVKDLTIEGAITSDATSTIGALANTVSGDLTVTGVTNKASVTAANATGVGGLVGSVTGTNTLTIVNAKNEGSMAGKADIGGFVGYAKGDSGSDHVKVTIADSSNSGDMSMTITGEKNHGVGGFIGAATCYTIEITSSINEGDITYVGGDNGVAGFMGGSRDWNNSNVTKDVFTARYCVNLGNITVTGTAEANGRSGGITGRLNRDHGSVYTYEYCYNVGDVTGKAVSSSGITGYTNKNAAVYVIGCYNIGFLNASNTKEGDVGYAFAVGTIWDDGSSVKKTENNYYIGINTGSSRGISAKACADKATLNAALLAIENSPYVVDPAVNDGYAILKWQCEHKGETYADCVSTYCSICDTKLGAGAGDHAWNDWTEKSPATVTDDQIEERTCKNCPETEERVGAKALGTITPVDGVYTVENENHMLWLTYNMNAGKLGSNINIVLKSDITLTNGMTYVNKTFSGEFDGQNHKISGLKSMVFSSISGKVSNLILEGDITSTEKRTGSLAREAGNGAVITNVHSAANVAATVSDGNVGGIIGYALQKVTIKDCSYSGKLTVTWNDKGLGVGGIVGWFNANFKTGTVENCIFSGEIEITASESAASQTMYVGGIIGSTGGDGAECIVNCVNTGKINVVKGSSSMFIGGIIGRTRKKTNTMENSVYNGTITAPEGAKIGVLVGQASAVMKITNSVGIVGDYPVCAEGTCTLENVYALSEETMKPEKIGNPFTMGGVTYQKYNFGYVNADTSALVSTGMTTDSAIGAYLSLKDNGDKHNVRFVLLANMEKLSGISAAEITITFKKGDEEVKTLANTFGGKENDFTAYEAVLAAGEPYFAAEGYALFGLVVVDIPDGEWDTVTLTATDAVSGDMILDTVTAEYPLG